MELFHFMYVVTLFLVPVSILGGISGDTPDNPFH